MNTEQIIEQVKTNQTQWINAFVKHDGFKSAMLDLVETQAEYAKTSAKAVEDFSKQVAEESVKVLSKSANFDFFKPFQTKK